MFKPAIAIALLACSMPAFAANDYPSARMQTALPSEARRSPTGTSRTSTIPTKTRSAISRMFWSTSPER
jgi:hypothetical protein